MDVTVHQHHHHNNNKENEPKDLEADLGMNK
jgi:hypothetical protein